MSASKRPFLVARQAADKSSARRLSLAGLMVGGLIVLGSLAIATPSSSQEPAQNTWFTEEQAERGLTTFVQACGGCHGFDQVDYVLESTNADFYFAFISGSMPWEEPGSLPLQEYADIVAFFLREIGLPAGDVELTTDREVLRQIVPREELARVVQNDAMAPVTADLDAWFTAEQAEQGENEFAVGCGGCHGAEMIEAFAGYETVDRYFLFITGSMPADDPGNLGMRQYLAVIAYLLQENGFPAGDVELTNDRELLSQIILGAPAVAN